jgi:MFS family permease
MKLGSDFWKFWVGQTISNFGTSLSLFALPLLVYMLTGSALNLGISAAINYSSYLLFGLVIGAWVDRVDRKRLMILTDATRTLCMASIPLLYALGHLPIWWIYIVGFISTSLSICFDAAEFAALPSLVKDQDITTANGRILASYSAATIMGPLLGGLLIVILPIPQLMLIDAGTFLISVCSLLLIKTHFNKAVQGERPLSSIRTDIAEGLRFVLKNPVLRNIAAMMAIINFLTATTYFQIVLFAHTHLHTNASETALFFSAAGLGVMVLALSAGWLSKRLPFGVITLGVLMLQGLCIIALALTPWYWLALVFWALSEGFSNLFNINTNSLRQMIVPNHMLGRVRTIASVIAWSVLPIGSLVGGIVIQKVQHIELIYGILGFFIFLTAFSFSFTALSHAERYLPQKGVFPASGQR